MSCCFNLIFIFLLSIFLRKKSEIQTPKGDNEQEGVVTERDEGSIIDTITEPEDGINNKELDGSITKTPKGDNEQEGVVTEMDESSIIDTIAEPDDGISNKELDGTGSITKRKDMDTEPESETDMIITDSAISDSTEQEGAIVENVMEQALKSNLIILPPRKKKKNSGHKIGLSDKQLQKYPDIIAQMEPNEDGDICQVLYCRLCQKWSTFARRSNRTWCSIPHRYPREDKVKDHMTSEQHKDAMGMELSSQHNHDNVRDNINNISSDAIQGIMELMKLLHWLISHNLPLGLFESLVNIVQEVDKNKIGKIRKGKNAKYTSPATVGEFLTCMSDTVEEELVREINESPAPAFALMLDEGSSAVAVRKMLGMSVKIIGPNGNAAVRYLTTKEVPDGKADTMVREVRSHFSSKAINSVKLKSLASDGASVMLGKKNGVGAKLREQNPDMISIHCNNHRLALAARDSFKPIKEMLKIEELLQNLYNYFHYSPNRSNALRAVQEAFEQAPLVIKQARHFRYVFRL